ncbi:hypothetical protein F4826_001394 [Rahnella inusitata]|nr:hypothetical protein [Rahnella inusitata]
MKNIILVVLYNEIITECETFRAILSSFESKGERKKDYRVVFWDNSIKHYNKAYIKNAQQALERLGLESVYIETPENIALSKIYNTIIDQSTDEDYLMIFDQDSSFDGVYFNTFEKSIKNNLPNIILPVVTFKNKIVSPTKILYLKGFYYDIPPKGLISSKHISAINSGMIISLNFIKKYNFRYNNKLKNYCTDDDIMKFVRNKNGTVFVMDYSFEHDLSLSTLNSNSDSLRIRYNEMIKSKKIVYSSSIFEKVFVALYFSMHRCYMCLRFRDLKYLKG